MATALEQLTGQIEGLKSTVKDLWAFVNGSAELKAVNNAIGAADASIKKCLSLVTDKRMKTVSATPGEMDKALNNSFQALRLGIAAVEKHLMTLIDMRKKVEAMTKEKEGKEKEEEEKTL